MIGSFALPSGVVVPVVQPLAPGPNPGATIVFSLDVDGLIDSDDFDRADSGTVGGNWTEDVSGTGGAEILSNALRLSGQNRPGVRNGAGSARVERFTQVRARWASATHQPEVVHTDLALQNNSQGDGYLVIVRHDVPDLRISRLDAGSITTIDTGNGGSWSLNTFYDLQFYAGAGVQEATADDDSTLITASAADTTHDAVSRRLGLYRANTSSATQDFDDALDCKSKNLIVSGLESGSGQKIQVIDSGGAVVDEATESSGTATLDMSLFGGFPEVVPLAGYPKLRIVDSVDALLAEWSQAIYPGHQVSVTGLS